MIHHVLLFRFYDDVPEPRRREAARMLEALIDHPELGVQAGWVAWQARASEKAVDLVEHFEFASFESLDAFRTHPAHRAVNEVFREISDWWLVDAERP